MMGVALIVLVLEAARRSTGWIMPLVCVLFLVYAMAGRICRRRGRIAATTSTGWSARCT